MNEIKKVLICGIGAIGSIYADKLNKCSQCELKVLVDEKRYENYIRNPKIFNGQELILDYVLPQQTDFKADLIIIATKYNALFEVVKNIKNFVKDDTIILSLLNGVTSEEIIAKTYGFEHILLSYFVGNSAIRVGNVITYDGQGDIVFGSKDGENIQDVSLVKSFFEKAGIDYRVPEDMYRALWLKYMLNVSANQVSAILGWTFGQMQNSPECMEFLVNVMKEVLELAKLEGVKNTKTMLDEALSTFAKMSPAGKTSMLQDVEAKRKTEVEMFAGHITELSERYRARAPYNKTLLEIIKIIENNY